MKKIIKDKQASFILKNKNIIVWCCGIFAIILGLCGFATLKDATYSNIIIHTLGLFVFEWMDYKDNLMLDIATIFATFTTSFGIVIIVFSKYLNDWNVNSIQKKPYNLLIGLSEQNISLLEHQSDDCYHIIIEKNKNHPHLEYFQERGSGIIVGFAHEAIETLNLSNMQRCVISTRYDRKNIALAKQIIDCIEDDKKKEIFVSISNRDLSVLFKQNILEDDYENINIETFSLYENMAKKVFFEHGILGNYESVIHSKESKEEFSVVVVGDSDLAIELVYHIAFLSALPDENRVTLYLIDNHAVAFEEKIKKTFPEIKSIPHLSIESCDVNRESLEFYQKGNVWNSTNLTNIYIATDNEEDNLDMAINLQDTTYIRQIGNREFRTKVLFALYHNLGLGEMINENKKAFSNFFTFANIEETSTSEIMFESKLDYIAKQIHYDYNGETDITDEKIAEKWKGANTHQRYSNRTQALHVDIKLLAFGLKRQDSKMKTSELLSKNRELFYSKIENYEEVQKSFQSYTSDDFPEDFDATLLNRVARSEHNRWNAFHYLNGWEYKAKRNNDAKQHNCLQALNDFTDKEGKETYKYDLMSVLSIPNYMAYTGYELIEVESN